MHVLSSKTDDNRSYSLSLYKSSKYDNVNILRRYINSNDSRAVLFTLPDGIFYNSGFYTVLFVMGWDILVVNTCPQPLTVAEGFTEKNRTFYNINDKSGITYTVKHRKITETQYQIYFGFNSLGSGEVYIMPFRYYEGYNGNMITEYTE